VTVLTVRTDKPEAELGLLQDGTRVGYETWEAHRQLAETIHSRIKNLLESNKLSFESIDALIMYKGPGSFTGLRIGLSIGNALANSFDIPIVGETGDDWIQHGLKRLEDQENDKIVMPEYGAPVHITKQKK
jgi:tRNA threonylcarbamoyladenosine biosynthesis protein TsaB